MQRIGTHRNLVSMIGYWHRSEPIMLIMEYVPHGDLLQWLRNKRQQVKLFCRFKTLVKNIDQMEGLLATKQIGVGNKSHKSFNFGTKNGDP